MDTTYWSGKSWWVKIGLIIIVLAIVVCMVNYHHDGRRYGSNDQIPQISVSGKGEIVAVPDTATFSFSVIEEGKTTKEAQDKATDRTNKAIQYLKDAGIDEKDIKTDGYNLNPKYDYPQIYCIKAPCPSPKQTLIGYEVTQTIEVKVQDTAKAGDVLAGIGSLGVQNISGLNFTFKDEDALARQARQKAITDAQDKAKALAKDLGVHLVRILSYNENANYPVMFSKGMAAQARDSAEVAPTPEVPVGQNTVTSNVTIVYEIR